MQIIHLKVKNYFFFKFLLTQHFFWHHQKKSLLTFLEFPLNKLSENVYFYGSITFSSQDVKKNILMGKKSENFRKRCSLRKG